MKIIFLSYRYWPSDFGGELLASIERLQSLSNKGFNVTVLTSGKPGLPQSSFEGGIRVLRSPVIHPSRLGRLFRRVFFALWVFVQLISQSYQVVHFASLPGIERISNYLFGWILAGISHHKGARNICVHSLSDDEDVHIKFEGLAGLLRKKFLKQMNHIVAVSPALYNAVVQHFPYTTVLIPYGIRDDIFIPLAEEERLSFRSTHDLTDENIVFMFLGSVGRRKGFDLLAEAFASLLTVRPNCRLWVIGPHKPEESQNIIQQEVVEVIKPLREVEDSVTFWGRINSREQLATILSTGDILVFPSRKEGMGIAPLEAMAAGTPVIISRLPGITDIASIEGKTGIYIPPDNIDALKEAMITLVDNNVLRQQMGILATQHMRQAFNWKSHLKKWETLYTDG